MIKQLKIKSDWSVFAPQAPNGTTSTYGRRTAAPDQLGRSMVGFAIATTRLAPGGTSLATDGSSITPVLIAMTVPKQASGITHKQEASGETQKPHLCHTNNFGAAVELQTRRAGRFGGNPDLVDLHMFEGPLDTDLLAEFPKNLGKVSKTAQAVSTSVVSARTVDSRLGPLALEENSRRFKEAVLKCANAIIIPMTWKKLAVPECSHHNSPQVPAFHNTKDWHTIVKANGSGMPGRVTIFTDRPSPQNLPGINLGDNTIEYASKIPDRDLNAAIQRFESKMGYRNDEQYYNDLAIFYAKKVTALVESGIEIVEVIEQIGPWGSSPISP